MRACLSGMMSLLLAGVASGADPNPREDGYRGIWFALGQKSEFGDKYSGGLGTYTAKHRPIAIYSAEARKTFFVYGGTQKDKQHLLIMVSYFDHVTKQVPRPVVVCDKQGVVDPHDNAAISIDGEGHIWIFVSGRARHRPGFKFRSVEPYAIDAFEKISEEEMTYPQPMWIEGKGFFYLFTKYTAGRELYWDTSADGRTWRGAQKLAGMGGHYQTAEARGDCVGTAFNWHPGGNVDKRTNLYYLQTKDLGGSWQNVAGETIATPLIEPRNPALVGDFQAEHLLVYLKDLQFDSAGRPVILFVTSHDYRPGPAGDPRTWTLARWRDRAWQFSEVTRSTHNYDMGQLWIEPDGPWRIIAPTEAGPSHWGAGGEVALWESGDEGTTWTRARLLTAASRYNHNYVRRPLHANPEFYAFWADGDPDKMSPSHLYFTNRACDTVYQLPYDMSEATATPVAIACPSR